MAISGSHALALLDAVGNKNAKGEFYLTDIVEIADARGLDVVATEASAESVLGINNRAEPPRRKHPPPPRSDAVGRDLDRPKPCIFRMTPRSADSLVEACLVRPGRPIASGVTIHAFSHVEGACRHRRGRPFARLRLARTCEKQKSAISAK